MLAAQNNALFVYAILLRYWRTRFIFLLFGWLCLLIFHLIIALMVLFFTSFFNRHLAPPCADTCTSLHLIHIQPSRYDCIDFEQFMPIVNVLVLHLHIALFYLIYHWLLFCSCALVLFHILHGFLLSLRHIPLVDLLFIILVFYSVCTLLYG